MTIAAYPEDPNRVVSFSIGETIASCFRIFGRAWGRLIGLLVLQILFTTIGVLALDLFLALIQANSPALVKLLNFAAQQTTVALGAGAIVAISFAAAEGRTCGLGEAFSTSTQRFGPMIGLCILQAIIVGIGFLLLIVPGLIAMVVLSVAVPACIVEGLGPLESCSRSIALTRGHRWAIFGLFALAMLASLFMLGAILSLIYTRSALTITLAILGTLALVGLILVGTTLSTALYLALSPADAVRVTPA